MVMDANQARQKYEDGINRIGIDAYRRAAQETTASGAAQVLEDAKTENFSASEFGQRFEEAY
jgi:hypothetical protein